MPIFSYKQSFTLESGEKLPSFDLEYQTFGALNAEQNNVVWIFHALTANSNPLEWWSGIVGYNKVISPDHHFIVCVNMPGSCYGSTNPLSINPETSEPYYHSFPLITTRDMALMFDKLRLSLGIKKIAIAIGGSMGGMQALEWAVINPDLIEHLIVIASNAKHSAWGIAFNTAQRMAIEADHTWYNKHEEAGIKGMQAARAVALLSYRNYHPFLQSQGETDNNKLSGYKAESYQYYQGQKLSLRFNAFSYYALTRSMDAHHLGRNRTSVENTLHAIKAKTLVIGIESDLLFPIEEQLYLSQHIPDAQFKLIDSPYGHDGFLIEYEQLTALLNGFLFPDDYTKTTRIKQYRSSFF